MSEFLFYSKQSYLITKILLYSFFTENSCVLFSVLKYFIDLKMEISRSSSLNYILFLFDFICGIRLSSRRTGRD